MKIYLIFVFFLIFIFSGFSLVYSEITGTSVKENVGISIIVKGEPIINITYPEENLTYTKNLPLSFSCKNKKTLSYSIDGGGIINYLNETILDGINTGQHFLRVNCTNDYYSTIQEIYFKMNTSILNISYDNFKDEYAGKTTDLDIIAYENLENISNLTFEDTRFGVIQFIDDINLLNDSNPNDALVDINSNIKISHNLIEINSENLPSFNKSAKLELYNLSFSNPRILKDGSVCPSDICTKESYSEGFLKFNVTHFTTYSSEETPITSTPALSDDGGSRGAGTEVVISKQYFSLDVDKIDVSLKQGEAIKKSIVIKNIGDKKINFSVQNLNLNDFINIDSPFFELESRESKTIYITFSVKEEAIPDLYIGKIIVSSGEVEKEILTAVNIEFKKTLFNVKVEIIEGFLKVFLGEKILARVIVHNPEKAEKIEVLLEYIMKNDMGEIISAEHETLAVGEKISFVKELKIPKNASSGFYNFYLKARYGEESATSNAWFMIKEESFLKKSIGIGLVIILAFFLIILYRRIKLLIHHHNTYKFKYFKQIYG